MTGLATNSDEEFYTWCLGNAAVLERAARRHAEYGDVVSAVATAWGADVYTLQAVTWERILVASHSPQRQFFRVADAVSSAMRQAPLAGGDDAEAGVRIARAAVAHAFDAGLAREMSTRWPDIDYLAALPPLDPELVSEAVATRLRSLRPEEFAATRRAEAVELMLEAQMQRVRGDVVTSIHTAFDSDLASLEAYLVESAVAAGDDDLMTVSIRWELATNVVSELPGLPNEFVGAVRAIRAALVVGLGEADGRRLLERLPAA
jgi:hypothetical protein